MLCFLGNGDQQKKSHWKSTPFITAKSPGIFVAIFQSDCPTAWWNSGRNYSSLWPITSCSFSILMELVHNYGTDLGPLLNLELPMVLLKYQ